jgi:hypothetical protein
MSETVIGQVKCTSCGSDANVSEGKGGILSIYCTNDDCHAQTLVKAPKAVASLRRRLAGDAPPEPALAGAGDDKPKEGTDGNARKRDWFDDL